MDIPAKHAVRGGWIFFGFCRASLANIGGSASAPILAGAYSGALVPVGVLMALMGYVIGTAGGLITANIMALLA